MFESLGRIWQKQKSPILFFGALALIVVLIFGNFASADRQARDWSIQVLATVTDIENQAQSLIDSSKNLPDNSQSYDQILQNIDSLQNRIKNQVVSIDNLSSSQQTAARQVPLYYRAYLETTQTNIARVFDEYDLERSTLSNKQAYYQLRRLLATDWNPGNLTEKKSELVSTLAAGRNLINAKRQKALEIDDTSRQGVLLRYYNTHDRLIEQAKARLDSPSVSAIQLRDDILKNYGDNLPTPQTSVTQIEQRDIFNVTYEDAKDSLRKAVGALFDGQI